MRIRLDRDGPLARERLHDAELFLAVEKRLQSLGAFERVGLYERDHGLARKRGRLQRKELCLPLRGDGGRGATGRTIGILRCGLGLAKGQRLVRKRFCPARPTPAGERAQQAHYQRQHGGRGDPPVEQT